MTRPIFEPTPQREDARLGFGSNQLFRRPGQIPAEGLAGTVEWAALSSTTSWGSPAYTDLDFSFYSGIYDTLTPTFDLSANDNLLISKGGVYGLYLSVIGAGGDGTNTTCSEVAVQVARVAGERPGSSVHSIWNLNAYYRTRLPTFLAGTTVPLQFEWWPVMYQNIIAFDADAFTDPFSDGPTEFQWQALWYVDGVETSNSDVDVRFYVVRFGDQWVDATS